MISCSPISRSSDRNVILCHVMCLFFDYSHEGQQTTVLLIHVVLGRGVRGRRTKFCTVTMKRLLRETTVRKPFQHSPCRSFAAPLQERLGLRQPLLDSGHTDTKLSYHPWRLKSSFAATMETRDTKSSNSITCADGYQGHEVDAKVTPWIQSGHEAG